MLNSIGCDIEETGNFINKTQDDRFLKKIFTDNELKYCFSKKNPEQHLCARFCAKEATIKALNDIEPKNINLKQIEVLNYDNGAPYIKIKNMDNIQVKVSLAHTKDNAIAFVILGKIVN